MKTANLALLLKASTLVIVAAAAILLRLYSVIRFESIIHEFDPWFNFRATRYLSSFGYYKFLNWFDDRTWYPLGRVTGGTLYPGLMVTSNVVHKIITFLGVPLDIRNVCVLFAPAFSGVTVLATYLLTKEMKDATAGLFAAVFMGLAPGYISRSVAGSYDNEAIAITLLMLTFFFWIKAVKLGSVMWATLTALSYFYMVSAWGGYVFITNMIPLHIFVLLLMGRYSSRIYVSYCTWYAIGTLASMQIPFVGFLPIRSSEHMSAFGVFGLLQLVAFADYLRSKVSPVEFKQVVLSAAVLIALGGVGAITILTLTGTIAPWTGRFYSLWDTNYAKIHIPIIASVSEHQPTAWSYFLFDTSFLIWLLPAGLYIALQELRDEHVFVIVYAVLGSYFAGVMVRLMLTLTPVVCVAGGITLASVFDVYNALPREVENSESKSEPQVSKAQETKAPSKAKKSKGAKVIETNDEPLLTTQTVTPNLDYFESLRKIEIKSPFARLSVLGTFFSFLVLFVYHCNWVTQTSYSSPSVVLASQGHDGNMHLIDDFREAYYWLRMNTKEDAKILSWWDYGYQIGGMANRTTLVDNNTWNNTHIATVGKALACDEDTSYEILRKHDVDYILVVFGGVLGYSGDDMNKFLWMVRIAEGIWPDEVNEASYFSRGQYRVDSEASEAMRNSMMYKMSYYRFAEAFDGVDRVRQQRLEARDAPTLDVVEEVFTTQNWLLRIYKVKEPDVLGRNIHKAAKYVRDKEA